MIADFAQHLVQTVSAAFAPAIQHNPTGLMVIAGFAVCNIAFYALTRGKEFIIGGLASALFLVPLVH